MPFVIDDAFLPATLTSQPMTDDEFVEFCDGYPDLFFEMTAEGDIIVMALFSPMEPAAPQTLRGLQGAVSPPTAKDSGASAPIS